MNFNLSEFRSQKLGVKNKREYENQKKNRTLKLATSTTNVRIQKEKKIEHLAF